MITQPSVCCLALLFLAQHQNGLASTIRFPEEEKITRFAELTGASLNNPQEKV